MEKIFCIGFPKTGTTSLEEALSMLRYKVCKGHYNNNHTNYLISLFVNKEFDEIDKIIDYYDVFTDLPWGGTDFYKYLAKKYPDASFIHTQREVNSWYISLVKMLTKLDANPKTAMQTFHKRGRYGVIYYLKEVIKVDTLENSKDTILNYFVKTNEELKAFFESGNFSYLSIDLIKGDGWDVLCPFLSKPVPNENFPHANKAPLKNIEKKGSSVKHKLRTIYLSSLFKKKKQ